MDHSVVIIGSGLGALECGSLLARRGYRVTVLEQHSQPGGCLQSFCRRIPSDTGPGKHPGGADAPQSVRFDCGFHYVGGLGEGESFRPLTDLFGLTDLPWIQLDPDGAEEVYAEGESFLLPSGHEAFADRLASRFPAERKGILHFTEVLKGVGDRIFHAFKPGAGLPDETGRSAHAFLCETIRDPLLRQVLSGTGLRMELRAETLPLYPFAQISNSFLQSAWRLEGGGKAIVDRLTRILLQAGGVLRTCAAATRLEERPDGSFRVEINGKEILEADSVIADIHPAAVLSLLGEHPRIRPVFRRRISGLENSFGMFTANLLLHPGKLPYLNRSLFIHAPGSDLWHPDGRRTESVLVHFYPEGDRIDLLSPMAWPEEAPGGAPGRRNESYETLKNKKLQECLHLAAQRLPGLEDAIQAAWTSTPRTWEDYTGTPGGSAYGIRKDWNNPLGTFLSVRSPLPHLFFTGQNVGLHGLLGVSMTAVRTCSCLLSDNPLAAGNQ